MTKEVAHQHQSGHPFLSYHQPGLFWSQEAGPTPRQQFQRLQVRPTVNLPGHHLHKQLQSLQHLHEKTPPDSKSDGSQLYLPSFSSHTSPVSQQQQHPFGSLSSSTSSSPMLLQQIQTVFATQNLSSQASLPGMLVPVRIQTHVPSFGSVMYTSVSQLVAHGCGAQGLAAPRSGSADGSIPPGEPTGGIGGGFNLSHFLGQTNGALLHQPQWKVPDSLPERHLNTGIPLSLTSGTISTTDASGSSIGGSKRMLSPASSLELFIETKQQKRVKEERMYGQIVKEMSAVELSGAESCRRPEKGRGRVQQAPLKTEGSVEDSERMSSSPPLSDLPTEIAIPVRSSAPHLPGVPRADSFTPPLQIITDRSPASCGRDSPEELIVDDSAPEPSSSPMVSLAGDANSTAPSTPSKTPVSMLVQLAASQSPGGPRAGAQTLLLTDVADVQQFFQFPSLRTISRVSWCFLNYTKPNSTPAAAQSSIYRSWSVSSFNPNPLNLSTKAALALLRSKQRRNTHLIYSTAAMSPPSSGKLVSSVAWKLRFDQVRRTLHQIIESIQ